MSFACSSIFCTRNGSDFTAVRLDKVASSILVLSNFAICSKHSFSSRLVTIANLLQLLGSRQHHYARLVQPLPSNLFFLFYTISFVYLSISSRCPLRLYKQSWDMRRTHVISCKLSRKWLYRISSFAKWLPTREVTSPQTILQLFASLSS